MEWHSNMMNPETELLEDILLLDQAVSTFQLIVHNDDVNTFDWVIESLIKICRHTSEQAEQCTYIIHFNGKAAVKTGSFRELEPMKSALHDRGISATIEKSNS